MTANSLAVPRFSRNAVSNIGISNVIQALKINFECLEKTSLQSSFTKKYFKTLKAFITLGFIVVSGDERCAVDYQDRLYAFVHSCNLATIDGDSACIPTSSSLIYFLRLLHFVLFAFGKKGKSKLGDRKKFIKLLAKLANTGKTRKEGLAPLLPADLLETRCMNIGGDNNETKKAATNDINMRPITRLTRRLAKNE